MGRVWIRDSRTTCEDADKNPGLFLGSKCVTIVHCGKTVHTESALVYTVVECNPLRMSAKPQRNELETVANLFVLKFHCARDGVTRYWAWQIPLIVDFLGLRVSSQLCKRKCITKATHRAKNILARTVSWKRAKEGERKAVMKSKNQWIYVSCKGLFNSPQAVLHWF